MKTLRRLVVESIVKTAFSMMPEEWEYRREVDGGKKK